MDYNTGRSNIVGSGSLANQGLCAVEPPKRSEMSIQMDTFNNSLEILDKSISNLISKLNPILSGSKPCNPENKDALSMQSELGKLMQSYNNRLSVLTSAINEINSRVEI